MPTFVEIENRVYNGPKYMDLGAPSGVVWEARLDSLPLSTATNATELRSLLAALGLTLTRASAATVQTSSSSLVTSGIGVDDPRVGDAGYGRGLVLEESRQNIVVRCRVGNPGGAGWLAGNAGTMTGTYANGPDGAAMTAARITVDSTGDYGTYTSNGITSAANVGSLWYRLLDRLNKPSVLPSLPAGAAYRETVTPGVDTWFRYVSPVRTAAATYAVQVHDTSVLSAVDAVCDCAQMEGGTWASELILTTGAAATRQPDRALLDSAARIVRGGRVGIHVRAALKGSIGGSNDYAADPFLWRYDANNYASINRTTGAVTVVIAGASYTTASGFTAARGDVVDYWVEAGGGSLQTVVKARKNGGAVTTLGTTSPQGTHPSATSMDLLSNAGSSGHLSCWLQSVRAYAPGRRPSWCA